MRMKSKKRKWIKNSCKRLYLEHWIEDLKEGGVYQYQVHIKQDLSRTVGMMWSDVMKHQAEHMFETFFETM